MEAEVELSQGQSQMSVCLLSYLFLSRILSLSFSGCVLPRVCCSQVLGFIFGLCYFPASTPIPQPPTLWRMFRNPYAGNVSQLVVVSEEDLKVGGSQSQ